MVLNIDDVSRAGLNIDEDSLCLPTGSTSDAINKLQQQATVLALNLGNGSCPNTKCAKAKFCTDSFLAVSIENSALSIEWNLIRPGCPVPGIVTKTVHRTLPGDVGVLVWWRV